LVLRNTPVAPLLAQDMDNKRIPLTAGTTVGLERQSQGHSEISF
jgi:hypothetical protein